MKLNFGSLHRSQPDPFIFADNGRYYLYVTAYSGVEAYSAASPFGEWKFEGIVCRISTHKHYWAPSIIRLKDRYFLYVSCQNEGMFQFLHVACADSPLGPFTDAKCLFDCFSIDSHVVQTEAGLFLWYAADNTDTERIGTRIYVDRMLDPWTPAGHPREVIAPTMDEEIFMHNRLGDGRDWHTIEGAYWFCEDGWQYVMYSGACFQNDTYHIGYAAAKTDEPDLTKVDFVKHTNHGKFSPVIAGNAFEEGAGHHSILQYEGQYYAVYHARDLTPDPALPGDRRTARICRLHVKNGSITAERYPDRL